MKGNIYRLTPPQAKILSSHKRFILVNAGRRFGKSWLAGAAIIEKAVNKDKSSVLYIAPTQVMARNIMWDGWLKEHVPQEWIARKNEQLMNMELKNGSAIKVLSADNPDRLRGLAADLLVLDECALLNSDTYSVIRPVLSDRYHDGEALFISTPQGYNWFYDLYMSAKATPAEWDVFEYTTQEGGNVLESEIESAKRTMSEKTFNAEYLASFENVAGRIYDNYDKELNSCIYNPDWAMMDLHVGMDFNVNPMTAVISVAISGCLYIFDELCIPNSNTQETASIIKGRYPKSMVFVYPDPTGNKRQTNAVIGRTDFDILRSNGFILCAPSHPYATKDKFNTVNAALCATDGTRRVFIDKDKCPHLRKAWDGYAYKENGEPDKSGGLDHISDAAAYLICYRMPFLAGRRVRKPQVLGV